MLTDRALPDVVTHGPLFAARDPLPFETSVPGVFAVGDVRSGSLKRVAAAVGEGSSAVRSVHDHLAWGLVGLYQGTQDEEIYDAAAGGLRLAESRALERGDFYALLPPRNDIHRVRTTSAGDSVSIHLLTNDTGCVWRHSYDPESGATHAFRSGYVNVPCGEDDVI